MNKGGLSQKQLKTIKELVTETLKIKEKFKTNMIVASANDLSFFIIRPLEILKEV
ncbi:MAG: hypothetical protein IPJ39_02230 [Saprospiraceae bacterium]|nr:hypothetical protein [Saprospiraceae bacterium]